MKTTQPHAVSSVQRGETTDSYVYDANGNMTQRSEFGVTWTQEFNAENRLASITNTSAEPDETWTFTYDGDGNRVKQVNPDGTITLFLGGGLYTVQDAAGTPAITKYYAVAGQRVAMDSGGTLSYLLTDHLGSVVTVLDDAGALIEEERYMPFGEPRLAADAPTDFGYTGQRALDATGLMDYNARWYDASLGRWTQPDALILNDLNRFSYVLNRPINLTDPSGLRACNFELGCEAGVEPLKPPPLIVKDVELTVGGKKARDFYFKLRNTPGPWNDYMKGHFSLEDFIAFDLSYEFHSLDDNLDSVIGYYDQNIDLFPADLAQASSRTFNQWCDQGPNPCNPSTNVYFNWLWAGSESIRGYVDYPPEGLTLQRSLELSERSPVLGALAANEIMHPTESEKLGWYGEGCYLPGVWGNESMVGSKPPVFLWVYDRQGSDPFYILTWQQHSFWEGNPQCGIP